MDISTNNSKILDNEIVTDCKTDLSKYFHPVNSDRETRFNFIYKLFGLNDDSVSRAVGIDNSTMNRYRRGVFEPTNKMKLLIAQKISELSNYQIDSVILWGDDWYFQDFKNKKIGEKEENGLHI